jgi:hypothetical protein
LHGLSTYKYLLQIVALFSEKENVAMGNVIAAIQRLSDTLCFLVTRQTFEDPETFVCNSTSNIERNNASNMRESVRALKENLEAINSHDINVENYDIL